METDPTYPIELITSYLAGEATGDDLVFLEAWLKADPGNRKIFDDYRKTWFALEQAKSSLNSSDEWNAFNAVHGARYTAHEKNGICLHRTFLLIPLELHSEQLLHKVFSGKRIPL
jgi:hypothetical protein